MTVTPIRANLPEPSAEQMLGLRAIDVCHIADVSYRQLDYWDRIGLVEPSIRSAHGSGSQRLYADQDVLRTCVIATLIKAGFSLSALREQIDPIMAGAADGVGFYTAPNVVITVDIAALVQRIKLLTQAAS